MRKQLAWILVALAVTALAARAGCVQPRIDLRSVTLDIAGLRPGMPRHDVEHLWGSADLTNQFEGHEYLHYGADWRVTVNQRCIRSVSGPRLRANGRVVLNRPTLEEAVAVLGPPTRTSPPIWIISLNKRLFAPASSDGRLSFILSSD